MKQDFKSIVWVNKRIFSTIVFILLISASALGAQRTGLSVYSQQLSGQFSSFLILGAAIALAVFGFAKAIGNYIGGKFSEKLGRNHMIRIGVLILLGGSWSLANSDSFIEFFLGNGTVGLGIGIIFASAVVSLTDVSTSLHRGKAVSMMELSVYLGTSIGSLISGIVADIWGFEYIFPSALVITLVLLLPGLFVVDTRGMDVQNEPDVNKITNKLEAVMNNWALNLQTTISQDLEHLVSGDVDSHHVIPSSKFTRRIFLKPSFLVTFFTGIVSRISDTAMVIVFPLLIIARGFSPRELGILVFMFTMAWSVGIAISGNLSDRIGRKIPLIIGLLLEILGFMMMFLLGLNDWFPILILGSVCSGIGRGIYFPIPPSAIVDSIGSQERAYVMGVYRFILDSGYVIGAGIIVLVVEFRADVGTTKLLEPVMILVMVFLLVQTILVSSFFKDPRPGYPQFDFLKLHFEKVQGSIHHLTSGIRFFVDDDLINAREELKLGKSLEREADNILESITKATYSGTWRGSDAFELLQFAISVDKSVGYTMRGLRKLLLVDETLSKTFKSKLDLYAQILDILVIATLETFESLNIRFNLAMKHSYLANYVEEYLDDIHKSMWEDLLGMSNTLKPVNLLLLSSVIDTIEKGANTLEDAAELIRLISFKH